jgi:hypothetical protein
LLLTDFSILAYIQAGWNYKQNPALQRDFMKCSMLGYFLYGKFVAFAMTFCRKVVVKMFVDLKILLTVRN